MDWQKLFLSAEGRIKRQEFWVGWAIVFVAGFVLGFIPIIHFFAWIAGLYVRVCLYTKRLHDMGKSGWLQLIPIVIDIVGVAIGLTVSGAGLIAAILNAQREGHANDPATAMGILAAAGGMLAVIGVLSLVNLGFLIWIGATEGEKGDNRYGSESGSAPEIF